MSDPETAQAMASSGVGTVNSGVEATAKASSLLQQDVESPRDDPPIVNVTTSPHERPQGSGASDGEGGMHKVASGRSRPTPAQKCEAKISSPEIPLLRQRSSSRMMIHTGSSTSAAVLQPVGEDATAASMLSSPMLETYNGPLSPQSPQSPASAAGNQTSYSPQFMGRRRASAAKTIARRLSSAASRSSNTASMRMSTSRELGISGRNISDVASATQARRNSRGIFSRNKSSLTDLESLHSGSRSSLTSNLSNVHGALTGMFSRASLRMRNSVSERDNTARNLLAAQNAHQQRMAQARREKMRDQGTEESPYMEDASNLENEPLNLRDENLLRKQLKNVCFWSWLGGKNVQDALVSAGVFGQLLDVLQARLADPIYEAPAVESAHHGGFMNFVGSTLGLSHMVAIQQQQVKISSKSSVAAIRAVATVCRDHLRNQSLAQQSGVVITLVELIAHPHISTIEKKWAVHAMNAAILSNAMAQDMVLGCSRVEELRSFCAHNFSDSDWEVWPNNEVACLMHMFDWKP